MKNKILVFALVAVVTLAIVAAGRFFLFGQGTSDGGAGTETPLKYCNEYEMPIEDDFVNLNCVCPPGKQKGYGSLGAYCATDSQKSCESSVDCPQSESCVSKDRINWFCTGLLGGKCYYYADNSFEPQSQICVD